MNLTLAELHAGGRGVEAERQRFLLTLLWGVPQVNGPALAGLAGLAGRPTLRDSGLAAYRCNAATLAPRALAAAYPTVAQLMGSESFAALARAHWHREAPRRGDLAWWGKHLPEAIEHDPQLAGEAYLADVARLDWAVHRAGFAADDDGPAEGLERLADTDPAQLQLRLRAGTAVINSLHPVVEIWRAHHDPQPGCEPAAAGTAADSFIAARRALLEGRAEAAWVTRARSSTVQTLFLDPGGARFTESLLRECTLEDALQAAGTSFNFEAWLIRALHLGALASVRATPTPTGPEIGPGEL